MARKQDNNRPKKNGLSSFSHSKSKISKKSNSKSSLKAGNKKRNQLQVKKLDKLDLNISDIVPRKSQEKSITSTSLEGRKVREHYEEDKQVVKEHDKQKKAVEKKLAEQLELISGFTL
ncbi:unnamed protein product [Kluyveromyces dobzhanskii CBS 2104]|uniref:WGS project CCBQ000000000 data, contig MAT n=1 Tax=Kluyveromyces dobzhanskii CBS 2104 TaxID=1427455 RepID=A0A0A8L0W4_9SACH|nr:unnamed protein product [Kluyveromyces dobzhanskii CBS 2104]